MSVYAAIKLHRNFIESENMSFFASFSVRLTESALSNTDLVMKAVGDEIQVQPLAGVMNIGAQKIMQFRCIIHTNVHDISTNRKKLNPPQWVAAAEAA
jgi:hypothetical protein